MSNNNLEIYKKLKVVPESATKKIMAGRIKGMTDIKPQWRIETLTKYFGPCGKGWKYSIEKMWTVDVKDEILCFVNIHLYVKIDEEWSEAIPGTGGNKIATMESRGLHASDEGFKMALTDAISVAGKALGLGADIYMGNEPSKYELPEEDISVPQLILKIADAKAMKHLINIWEKYKGYVNSLEANEKQMVLKAKDSRKQQLEGEKNNGKSK